MGTLPLSSPWSLTHAGCVHVRYVPQRHEVQAHVAAGNKREARHVAVHEAVDRAVQRAGLEGRVLHQCCSVGVRPEVPKVWKVGGVRIKCGEGL